MVARVLKVLPREQAASADALLAPQLAQALSAAVRQELDELWSRLGGPRA